MASTNENANVRQILLRMGIGDFNATLVIPLMFMGPAQTDPDITASKVLVKQMQHIMQSMGAGFVQANGRVDKPTADCLHSLVGPHWSEHPWFEICVKLLDAQEAGKKFSMRGTRASRNPVELAGFGLFDSLPDVPGGPIVLGIAAYVAYRYFKKRK